MDGAGRLQNLLEYEERFWSRGFSRIAGVDEAGRGPLAGPVVAAAVILPPGAHIPGARDSKTLSRRRREELVAAILSRASAVSLGAASVREIDCLNILVSTRLAMDRALKGLAAPPEHVVVDGLPVRGLLWEHDAIVKGDDQVHSIACASIVAKVVRDRLMLRLSRRYPGYGWETNMGYGTEEHRNALERLGPTPHHRRSFGNLQGELGL
ncbi:MAG: ribonuclease HII [Gemmatimonadota bacterium]|jgi:ribonuclease HII